jgi:anti-sigma factor RsiW
VHLRDRVDRVLPSAVARAPRRRALLQGFALGGALSAVAATGIVMIVFRANDDRRIMGEVVSAHVRSLQAEHLTDVQTSDQHTVRPWFSGRLGIAPPVVDLTAQGFTLVGGRMDYVDGRSVGAIVYRRRLHVINLFVGQVTDTAHRAAPIESVQGFNIRRWQAGGLAFWAVSDLNADELQEFGATFEAALHIGDETR